MGTLLEIAAPAPGAQLTAGEPVSIRVLGGSRPFHFLSAANVEWGGIIIVQK
jgi:penicillin-binding protein 1C